MPEPFSFQQRPEYKEAKALYFSTTLSVKDVAEKLVLNPWTVRYWAQKEQWRLRRDTMLGKPENAQRDKESRDETLSHGQETSTALALLDQITELRALTKADLGDLINDEPVARHRRYLAVVLTAELLLERAGREKRALDVDRLSKAASTLFATAEMLAGRTASVPEKPKRKPQKPRRAARADVREAAEAMGVGAQKPPGSEDATS
jgi:hypothetical protein